LWVGAGQALVIHPVGEHPGPRGRGVARERPAWGVGVEVAS
jgi:hypothetical protein